MISSGMTSTTCHITIGRDFFAGAPRDYSDPSFALIREFVQNGVDAKGSTEIRIDLDNTSNTLRVSNNGEPMSRDTLLTQFLSLGGTTKGVGSVGGFGKAKELLCFTHHSFTITTGTVKVIGSGATYTIQDVEPHPGTTTQIVYDGTTFRDIERSVRKLAAAMKWDGRLTLNGEWLTTNFTARTRRNLDNLGSVKAVEGPPQLIVRAGGIPMFINHCDVKDTTVLVDLEGDTKTILTANRDGLRWSHRQVLESFIATISTNRRELNSRNVTCTDYGTELTVVKKKADTTVVEHTVTTTSHKELEEVRSRVGAEQVAAFTNAYQLPAAASTTEIIDRRCRPVLNERFTIRNETGLKLDRAYMPDTFSAASKRLHHEWVAALMFVHEALGIGGEFATGFIFSEDSTALHERRDGVSTYYVNPVAVAKVKFAGGEFRTMRRVKYDRHDLRAFACHEIIHGAFSLRDHDEAFSAKLTFCMAKVLRHKPAK